MAEALGDRDPGVAGPDLPGDSTRSIGMVASIDLEQGWSA